MEQREIGRVKEAAGRRKAAVHACYHLMVMATPDRASSRPSSPAGRLLAPLQRLADRIVRTADWLTSPPVLAGGTALSLALGCVIGLAMVYIPDPTPVQALEAYQPSIHSILYDAEGRPFDEWVIKKREIVRYDDIPDALRHAILATEDSRFFSHPGVDPIGVMRAVWRNLTRGFGEEGASTISMQLSRDLWLTADKRLDRKIIEAFYYTLQTERYFSKERIFELYATQSFLGHNVYGFAVAADYYFDKELSELTLAESAMLAGMLQRPNDFNLNIHPAEIVDARAQRRRGLVLQSMVSDGYITAEQAEIAGAQPIGFVDRSRENQVGAYFVEEIRKDLMERYEGEIYETGLQIYTTLERRIQEAAELALQSHLRATDKRQGWRGDQPNLLADEGLLAEGKDLSDYHSREWDRSLRAGGWMPAVVTGVAAERADLRIGDQTAVLTLEGTVGPSGNQWIRRGGVRDLTALLEIGDLVSVQIRELSDEGEILQVGLDQEPEIEGAVLVVENITGEVVAMVGGREFDRSEFNRARQAVRQTGSAFKPFVYATALREGWTASDLMLDEPKRFEDPSTGQPYEPGNYADQYVGITTLAESLAKSRNVVTVELQQEVGADDVIDMARGLGITANLQPYLSLALGVIDASLWEMTRAYAVFPNGGVRVEPHLVREIRDRQGRPLQVVERQATQVMNTEIAYLMTRMLVNVIQYCKDGCAEGGTGRAARGLVRELGIPLGGKTGTTDDYSDAWFIGFSPYHTVGVWVGNDTKKPIGPREEGARVALPIWMDVMRAASEGREPATFDRPPNVVLRTVDPQTGMLAGEYCSATIEMAYVEGTEPTAVCSSQEHGWLSLPWYQQAYFIDEIQQRSGGGSRH